MAGILIIIGGVACIVVIAAIILGVGFGVDAANCWADENETSFCDYMITVKVEDLPKTTTR